MRGLEWRCYIGSLTSLAAVALLVSAATAQSQSPWIRLDLIFVRIDIGGATPGLSAHLGIGAGVDLGVIAVGAGIGFAAKPKRPLPVPAPIERFLQLESQLQAAIERLSTADTDAKRADAAAAVGSIMDKKKPLAALSAGS